MGWNDSRARLIAPGWRMIGAEGRSGALAADGTPVRILRVERVENAQTARNRPEAVRAWLEERGFVVTHESAHGDSLQREDIEANLDVIDNEVAEITLTFTLTPDSPSRWRAWESIVEEICETWCFGLYSSGLGFTVEPAEILRALADTPAWREFAANFNWPQP
jgi:hypothetical protein